MKLIKKYWGFFTEIVKKVNDIWNKLINQKYIQKVFLFLPHNFFLFLLFLLSIGLILTFDYNRFIPIYTYQGIADGSFDPILEEPLTISLENINKEKFLDTAKSPNSICIRFATYDRKNNAEYKYIAYKNNEKILEEEFNSKILDDGKFTCFALPEATKENSHEYSIEIAPIRTDKENSITIFRNTQTNEAAIQLAYEQPTFSIKLIFVFIFFIISLGINFVINKKKWTPEKFWLLLAIFYILPITCINPPYEVPDEPIHFYTAYRLTQGDKNKNFYENQESLDMTMPETIDCIGYVNIQTRDKVVDKEEVKKCFQNANNTTKKSIFSYVGAKVAFFASAFGIKIADIFTNSPGIIFYMGRLMNALLSVFIIYKALKIAPKHKELLLVVATIPMFVQQMVSYSYDSFLNTFSILGIAVMLKLIYEEKTSWKMNTFLLFLCGMIISNIKVIYLPIFLLLLFIPDKKFTRKIDKYIYTFSIIAISYLLGNICTTITATGKILSIFDSALAIFGIGIATKMNLEKETNWKVWGPILFFIGIGIAYLHALYLFVVFVFLLFIPNQKCPNKWVKFTGIMGGFVLALILGKIGYGLFNSQSISETVGSSKIATKIMYLVTHPMKTITLFYCTFKIKTVFYLRSLIGYFGWFNFHLNDIYVLAYIFFVIYLLAKTESNQHKWYEKGFIFMGLALSIAAVFLAMYVFWSGIELFYIDGVQGRYFIPLLVPMLLLFTTSKKKKNTENVKRNTYHFINIVLLEYVTLILLFYY